MPTIAEVKKMKSKALRNLIKGLDTEDKHVKLSFIRTLGDTVAIGVKVDTEQKAIDALQKETQDKSWRVKRAAKKALVKIRTTKRMSPNPFDMFDGGVGFSSKK